MKLSVSAYRAHASAHKKILTSSYQQHYGSTAAPPVCNPPHPPNFTPQVLIIVTRSLFCASPSALPNGCGLVRSAGPSLESLLDDVTKLHSHQEYRNLQCSAPQAMQAKEYVHPTLYSLASMT